MVKEIFVILLLIYIYILNSIYIKKGLIQNVYSLMRV